jgi:hypothetical protein
MKILKGWEKFNENDSRYHFDENKPKIENVEFVLNKNGVYSLDLNLDLRQIGADMIIPNIRSVSQHPYCLVSKDKTLLSKLEEYLKGLEFDDFNGVEWYDSRPVNNAVCPFLGEKEVPYFGRTGNSTREKYSEPMMCEITKEDLLVPSTRDNFTNVTNNLIMNDELWNRCKENMGDLPEGKVFSYFTVYSHKGKEHLELGIDVTEGLKKFLNM